MTYTLHIYVLHFTHVCPTQQWAGQLGDGRAIVLGETQNATTGESWELQLKVCRGVHGEGVCIGVCMLRLCV